MTRELFEEYDLTIAELNKENQELKLELSGYRQAILNNEEMLGLKEQNEKLKKQLKDKTEDYKRMKDNFDSKVDVLTKIETQQKEFINYLNSYIDLLNDKPDMLEETQKDILEEILQKYKEIIGVLDENKRN